jgi:uncharacterized protein (DUF2225 family)
MGSFNSRNSCCPEIGGSFHEICLEESIKNSFCRGSSYESPIPDEVFQYESFPLGSGKIFKDDCSTDYEKFGDISREPSTKELKKSLISLGSKQVNYHDIF